MLFFVGWHQPTNGQSGCHLFPQCMISVNRLTGRKSDFQVKDWILDSGAFTRILSSKGHLPTRKYAKLITRWSTCGNLLAAVSQDYMCEQIILSKTRLTIKQHQELTILRYDNLRALVPNHTYIMPVLQGYSPQDYVTHLKMYGDRLTQSMWVGVGSVCKRNGLPAQIEAVLMGIHNQRPDLKLHGFGVKKTALQSSIVWDLLYSADSQAHSYGDRFHGTGNQNNPQVALLYSESIRAPQQLSIFSRS